MKKRIILGLIFVLLLLIIAVSILPKPQDPFNWKMVVTVDENNTPIKTNVTYDSKTGESFGIGLYETPIHSPEYSMQLTKTVHENTSFEGYYWISNQMYDPHDYLIFCLIDYEQVPVSLDGSPPQVLHRVDLAPLEERFFHVEIGPLGEGGHDCEIFALLKTEEHSLDPDFRLSTDFAYLGSKRVNLLVNSTTMRTSGIPLFARSAHGSVERTTWSMTVPPYQSPCRRRMVSADVRAGDDLAYWINVAADSGIPYQSQSSPGGLPSGPRRGGHPGNGAVPRPRYGGEGICPRPNRRAGGRRRSRTDGSVPAGAVCQTMV